MTAPKSPIRLMNRGSVSKETRGFANLFVYEMSFPPFNTNFLPWP